MRPLLMKGHERLLTFLRSNKDNDLLFSCAKDHTPTIWFADNGEHLVTYRGHNGAVWCCDISSRKALQPRNIFLTPKEDPFVKPKAAAELKKIVSKENVNLERMDASLAEELSGFKKKLERLREDRESTEKVLKERDEAMDLHMTHLLQRGEAQKSLEIQVDRLFRLKELYAYSSKISPIPSLRAKEQEKKRRFSFEPVAGEPDQESSVKKNLHKEIIAHTPPP